jgi:glyoxylase-like metal-dependent hydrolase (beta-lactamase superfamily II)
MLIQEAGFVADNVLLLGSRHICIYLIMGDAYALLGGGVSWEVARLEAQLNRFQVDRDRIRYLVVSHAHYDHCGAVPYLMQRHPHLKVVASDYGAHILNKDKAVQLMRDVNRQTLDALHKPHHHNGISLEFKPVPVAVTVGDGDRVDLGGGVTLEFYLTPGHSRCSLSTYVAELKALFPAEAVPYPESNQGKLIVTATHDYDDYIRSLEKLKALEIRLVGYEHGGALTGKAATSIISRGLGAARRQRQRIIERYNELQDIDRLVEETAENYHTLQLFRLIPFDVLRTIIHRMVRSALGQV